MFYATIAWPEHTWLVQRFTLGVVFETIVARVLSIGNHRANMTMSATRLAASSGRMACQVFILAIWVRYTEVMNRFRRVFAEGSQKFFHFGLVC